MARLLPESARGWVAWLSPGLMILIGAVLFFIPAPPTSLIGVGLVIVGGALWLIDYFGGEERGRIETREETEQVEEAPARMS